MAKPRIELQDMLNRKEGPGKIGPETPLETRLYGPNGQPIGTDDNPLRVSSEGDTSAITEAINTLSGSVATETTLASVLGKLIDSPSTAQGQTEIAQAIATLAQATATEITLTQAVQKLTALVERLNETLDVSGEVTFPTPQKVQLSGQIPPIYGADISERPPANDVPVGQQFILVNENLDAWISNGTDWVVI